MMTRKELVAFKDQMWNWCDEFFSSLFMVLMVGVQIAVYWAILSAILQRLAT